jgi:hypothetical protein
MAQADKAPPRLPQGRKNRPPCKAFPSAMVNVKPPEDIKILWGRRLAYVSSSGGLPNGRPICIPIIALSASSKYRHLSVLVQDLHRNICQVFLRIITNPVTRTLAQPTIMTRFTGSLDRSRQTIRHKVTMNSLFNTGTHFSFPNQLCRAYSF